MSPHYPVITAGFDGHDIQPGDPRNPKAYPICGAPKNNGEVCQNRAGWRTYHPGAGRCVHHSGGTRPGPRKPGGRYSALFVGQLSQALEPIAHDTSDPLDLLPELEVQRAILTLMIGDLAGAVVPHTPRAADPVGLADAVRDVWAAADAAAQEEATPAGGSDSYNDSVGYADTADGVAGMGIAQYGGMEEAGVHPGTEFFSKNPSPVTQEKLDAIRLQVDSIVTTVTKIIDMKNKSAVAASEVALMMATIREAIKQFVPAEQQGAFINYIRQKIMGKFGKEEDDV